MAKFALPQLPEYFVKTVIGVYGEEGEAWLVALPEILASVAARYELTLGAPFGLSYNYVCAATQRDDTPVVLKLSPPDGEAYAPRLPPCATMIYEAVCNCWMATQMPV